VTLRIFISYSHANNAQGRVSWFQDDLLRELNEAITDEDVEIYLAEKTLEIGTRWKSDIERNLNICDFFLPICTERYFTSDWCAREWGLFRQRLLSSVPDEMPLPDRLIPIWWRPLRYIPPILEEYHMEIAESPISTTNGLVDFLLGSREHGVYPKFVKKLATRIRHVHDSGGSLHNGRALKLIPKTRAFEIENFHRGTRSCNVVYDGLPLPEDEGVGVYNKRELWDPFCERNNARSRKESLTHWHVFECFPVLNLDWTLQRFNMNGNEIEMLDGGREPAGEGKVFTIALAGHENLLNTKEWLKGVVNCYEPEMLTVIVPLPPVEGASGCEHSDGGFEENSSSLADVMVLVATPKDLSEVLRRKLKAFWAKRETPPSLPADAPVVNPWN
jgi:hypothetical protein